MVAFILTGAYRRDVAWTASRQASILPLLQTLEFSTGVKNWGYQFRYGLIAISEHDMRVIAAAMGVTSTLFDNDNDNDFAAIAMEANLQLGLDLN